MAAHNTKHKHSKFLFYNQENAEPMVFYMRPCADRGLLRSLIEHGGGTVTVKSTPNSIKLAMKTDQVSTDNYLLSSYITDCVRENKLLDTKDYKMKPKKTSVNSSKDQSMNLSISEDIDDMSPADVIQPNTKSYLTAGRMNYSLEDDMNIIKYAVENCDNKPVKGMALFRDMAMMKVTAHSAESMNTRFRKIIIHQIDSYDIPDTWKFKLTQNSTYLKSPSPSKVKKHTETPEITCGSSSQPISCSSSEDIWDKDLLSNALTIDSLSESPPSAQINKSVIASSSPKQSTVTQKSVNSSPLHSSPIKATPVKTSPIKTSPIKTYSKDATKRTSAHAGARNIFDDLVNGGNSSRSDSQKDEEKTTETVKVSEKSPMKSCKVVLTNCSDEKTETTESQDNSTVKSKKSQRKSERLKLMSKHHQQKETENSINKSNEKKKCKKSHAEKRKMATPTLREELGSRQKKERLSFVQNLDNVKDDCIQRDSRSQQNKERLNFVQDLDNLEHCSQTESHNGEASQSERAGLEDDEEVEENCKIVKKMADKYNLTVKEILYILYINDGSFSEAERWILTGCTSKGRQAWDVQSDELLKDGSKESMAMLKKRYGNSRVRERILFLETE